MIRIVGNGNMSKALCDGLSQSNIPHQVFARSPKAGEFPLSALTPDTQSITLLAVKPYALAEVAQYLQPSKLIISILAGTSIETIKRLTQATQVIRAMPNIGAQYGTSFTTCTGDEEHKAEAMAILNAFGKTMWLDSEKEIDIATAIAGSGPAFLALVAEGMMDGGVVCGLTRTKSEAITNGLFESFVAILANLNPSHIKNTVMSPAGTTAAGIESLEASKVRSAFIQAIKSANERAQSLKQG